MFLMLLPVALFAQDSTIVVVTPDPPTSPWDLVLHFNDYIASFAGFAVATTFLAALLNGFFKFTKTFYKQLVAWGVAFVVLAATNLLNIGYAANFDIIQTVINGLAIGLAANGIFDIPFLKTILVKVEGWFPPKK